MAINLKKTKAIEEPYCTPSQIELSEILSWFEDVDVYIDLGHRYHKINSANIPLKMDAVNEEGEYVYQWNPLDAAFNEDKNLHSEEWDKIKGDKKVIPISVYEHGGFNLSICATRATSERGFLLVKDTSLESCKTLLSNISDYLNGDIWDIFTQQYYYCNECGTKIIIEESRELITTAFGMYEAELIMDAIKNKNNKQL